MSGRNNDNCPGVQVSLAGHSAGTGAFGDVRRALLAWEVRNGLRDASGYLKERWTGGMRYGRNYDCKTRR